MKKVVPLEIDISCSRAKTFGPSNSEDVVNINHPPLRMITPKNKQIPEFFRIFNKNNEDDSLESSIKEFLIEKAQFNFSEIEELVNFEDLSQYKSNKDFLERMNEIEETILQKIRFSRKKGLLSKYNKSVLKDMAFHLLDDKIREYHDIRTILQEIRQVRNVFFTDIQEKKIQLFNNDDELIAKLKHDTDAINNDVRRSFNQVEQENMKKEINESLKILKVYYKKYYNLFKDRLNEHFQTKCFPNFLIREIESKLKKKVNRQLIPKFKSLSLQYHFLTSLEYQLIVKSIEKIQRNELQLFSDELIPTEANRVLFKCIYLLLKQIFTEVPSLEINTSLFDRTIEKYATIMNINNYKDCILNYDSTLFENNIKELFEDYRNKLGKNLLLYIFTVLCLTLMLSNYDIVNKKINENEIESREKECLIRMLYYFTKYGSIENCNFLKFGLVLQSTLFAKFFTNAFAILNQKTLIKTDSVIDLNNNAFLTCNNKIDFVTINNKISNCKDKVIVNEYLRLLKSIPIKKKKSCCQKIGLFLHDFFLPSKEKKPSFNFAHTKLIPYDKRNNSSQTCIIVHGFISERNNLYTQWENFIIDFDCYVDFYFYTWDSKRMSKILQDVFKFLGSLALTILTRNFLKIFEVFRTYQHRNNVFAKTTKISSYAGKLLAYIIASKAFFEHKTITLVGFSLGAHVVKHTLKELNQISIYCPWVKNIIQNVVFIGGATCLPKKKKSLGNLRELVAGRVINVYNPNDEVLTSIYKTIVARDPFGIYPIELDGVKVENYDFSDLKIGHVEYWDYTNIIIKKINLF